MFARFHCGRCPWTSSYLRSERVSAIRATQSGSGGVSVDQANASATPSYRKTERSPMVSQRNRLVLYDGADCLDFVRPSLPLQAVACDCVEIRDDPARLVRRSRRWLPTHVVRLVDRRGRGEGLPCCPPRFLGPGVAAQTGLSATQANAFNAARLSGWRRLFEPAVPSPIHTRRLRRKAPVPSSVAGNYPSGVPAQVRPSCLLRPYGVLPWP